MNPQIFILIKQVDSKQFTSAVLINNAGSLGDKIKSITNHTDVNPVKKYMDLNITSCFYLTYVVIALQHSSV